MLLRLDSALSRQRQVPVVATATQEIPLTQAGKGHVPEENLERYRHFARIARQLDSLGSTVSGHGEYDEANRLWALSIKYWGKANALRVDIPQQEDPTLTTEAVAEFREIAEEAERDIAALPEGSQPLWFRTRN